MGAELFTLGISVLCGSTGYFAEPRLKPDIESWPFLEGLHEVRRASAVGFWHDGACFGGFIGTIAAGFWVQWQRNLLWIRLGSVQVATSVERPADEEAPASA